MIEASVSNITKFLDSYIEPLDDTEIKEHISSANELFKKYNEWKEKSKHKDDHNSTSFGREMSSHPGVSKFQRDSAGNRYKINVVEVIQYFKINNLFGYKLEKNDGKEVSEVDKLRAIIKDQQKEILELRTALEKQKLIHSKSKKQLEQYDSDDEIEVKPTKVKKTVVVKKVTETSYEEEDIKFSKSDFDIPKKQHAVNQKNKLDNLFKKDASVRGLLKEYF